MRKIERIVVHCTAGNPAQSAASLRRYFLTPTAQGGKGWDAPGYHYVIEQDGKVVQIQPEELVAYGAKGYNATSIHVAYTGGVRNGKPADTRTEAQKSAIVALLKRLKAKYPAATVCGHRDLSPDLNGDGIIEPSEWIKACPCFEVKKADA
jgi:N-acetyl-anhydromuramyl-L-alanine amidase AmpD